MTTKLEREYLNAVAGLGCIVCANNGFEDSPAEIHHIRDGHGIAQRAPFWESIPLCPIHHRLGDGTAKCGGELGFHAAASRGAEEPPKRIGSVELKEVMIVDGQVVDVPQEDLEGKLWIQRYGTEEELVAQVRNQLSQDLLDRVAPVIYEYYQRIQRSA